MAFSQVLSIALVLSAASATPSTHPPIEVESILVKVDQEVKVPAREAGVLSTMPIREGQIVKSGQLLARIEDEKASLAHKRAQLDLTIARETADNDVDVRFAEKSLAVSRAELRRAKQAIKRVEESVSQTELDQLQLSVDRDVLRVEQAKREFKIAKLNFRVKKNELDSAKVALVRHEIRAPVSGMVVDVHKRKGEWVEPGEAVFRVIRLDRLRAEGFVKHDDLGFDLMRCSVKVIVDLPGKPATPFQGSIIFVSPEVDPGTRQVRVWARIENDDLVLRPGLRGRMSVSSTAAQKPGEKPQTAERPSVEPPR